MEERERLRRAGDEIKFADLGFLKEDKLQDNGKEEEGESFHSFQFVGINDGFWDKIRGHDSEIWKWRE